MVTMTMAIYKASNNEQGRGTRHNPNLKVEVIKLNELYINIRFNQNDASAI